MNRVITHYEVLEKLGEGGMGVVYKARDLRLGRFVALKILSEEKLGGVGFRERCLREARTASSLNHPNIVTIYEVDSADGMHLIAMEYVEGDRLDKRLAAGGLPLAQALRIGIQIAKGAAKAHSSGIVHRDLKPANVMVTQDGTVKILDFGLAKRFDKPSEPIAETLPETLTVSGIILGTVSYMSPEQALGEPLDARSDLFSFGVILHEMFAGARPFSGKSPMATLQKIQVDPAPKLRLARPEVPEAIERIIEKALEKDRARRPQSADEIAETLREVLSDMTAADTSITRSLARGLTRMSMRSKIASLAVLVAFIAGLALGTITLWSGLSRRTDEQQLKLVDPTKAAARDLTASEWTQQGRAYLKRYDRQQNLNNAIEAFKKATERDPRFAPGYAGLAEACARKNALSPDPQWMRMAMEASRMAVELDPDLALAHQARGIVLLQSPQVQDAGVELGRATELDPRSSSAAMWLAEYFAKIGDKAQAEKNYEKATTLDSTDWTPHAFFGLFLYKATRYDEAVAQWEKAKELSPDNVLVLRNLSAVYHMVNRDEDAASAAQRALEFEASPGIYNNLATARFYQGRYRDAAAAFGKAVEANPTNHLYWGNMGDAYRWVPGGEDEAKKAYTRASQLVGEKLSTAPDDAALLGYAATYAVKNGEKMRALDFVQRMERLDGREASAYFKSAVVYEIAGNRENALRDLGIAVRKGHPVREVQNDPELVSLRSDRRYHQIVSEKLSSVR